MGNGNLDRQVSAKIGQAYSTEYLLSMLNLSNIKGYSETKLEQTAWEIGIARTPANLGISSINGNSGRVYVRSRDLQCLLDKLEIGIEAKHLIRKGYNKRTAEKAKQS